MLNEPIALFQFGLLISGATFLHKKTDESVDPPVSCKSFYVSGLHNPSACNLSHSAYSTFTELYPTRLNPFVK